MNIKELTDCINNPVKSQILLYLQEHKRLTAKELLSATDSIPQATLYRTLKRMEETNFIYVISETQRRGIMEKTYALSETMKDMEQSLLSSNDGDLYARMFSIFITQLLLEFDNYSKKDNIDIANDGSGFSAVPIYATTEELMTYGQQIRNILEPAFKRQSKEQTLHSFATIITPPRKEDS